MQNTIAIDSLFVNFSRAYQIARVGNFTMQCFCAPEYKGGAALFNLLKSKLPGATYVSHGADLNIELLEPYELFTDITVDQSIFDKINRALGRELPTVYASPSSNEALLRTAVKYGLNPELRQLINRISAVIAQLDGNATICVVDFAEAIQYVSFNGYGCIPAEDAY